MPLASVGDGEGGRLEIIARDTPPLVPPHHLAFAVDNFEGTLAALREAGAHIEEASTNPFGDKLLLFSDPASNYAQIVERVEPLAH